MSFRSITTDGFPPYLKPPERFGKPPRLEWLPISQLVIDPEYQREITAQGRGNIRRIVAEFDWGKFTPVVVSIFDGCSDRYAIVDGQHRTTAAMLCKIETVPCAIIEAVRGEQAAAFKAINGNTTRMHTIQLFHAAVVAGDANARQVLEVCKSAGVIVSRSLQPRKPRETFCVGAIGKGIERYGAALVGLALRCIVRSGEGAPEDLSRTIIASVIEVLAGHREWCRDEEKLLEAFDEFELEGMWRSACVAAARVKGISSTDELMASLTERLLAVLGKQKPVVPAAPRVTHRPEVKRR